MTRSKAGAGTIVSFAEISAIRKMDVFRQLYRR